VEFVPAATTGVTGLEYSAEGKSSERAYGELRSLASSGDVGGKIVLLRVSGELSVGKTSDIDFGWLRRQLEARGAVLALTSFARLTSREQADRAAPPKPPNVTERQMFESSIASVRAAEPSLTGAKGVDLSLRLLATLREERRENEEQGPYQSRVERSALKELGLEGIS